MAEFVCDYKCRTVGESITKYSIPDDWCCEFDACDDGWPIICIRADQIRMSSALMEVKLRIVENEDEEYAGCMAFTERKMIAFKVDNMAALVLAMEKE